MDGTKKGRTRGRTRCSTDGRFLDAWMQGVRPLRLKHGFRIDAAWGSFRNGTSSPCAMSYDGPGMRM
jgi:hypothetical protein